MLPINYVDECSDTWGLKICLRIGAQQSLQDWMLLRSRGLNLM